MAHTCTCVSRVEKYVCICSESFWSRLLQNPHTISVTCFSFTAISKENLKQLWHRTHWHDVRDCT